MSIFTIFAIGDIFTHTTYAPPINLQIHRSTLIFNILIVLLFANYCATNQYLTNPHLPNTAFIVFCVRYPIVIILLKKRITESIYSSDIIHIPLYCMYYNSHIDTYWHIYATKSVIPHNKELISGNR